MFDILSITIPIYVAIGLGYGLTRWGIFPKSDMRAFGTFVVKVAMPALLFNALSQRSIKEILNPDYVMAYATGSILMLSLSIFWALRVGHHSRSMSSCLAMGMSCPNSGFVGYPIALLSFGSMAGVSLALNMMVENLLIIPILLAWAESGQGGQKGWQILLQSLKGMLKNPMIWGILLGFVCAWFGLTLPSSLSRTVQLFAQASGALSLFVIGGSLVGLSVKGMEKPVTQIVVGKLIIHPMIIAAVMFWVFPISEPILRTALLLTAALPIMGIYPILMQKHGHDGLSAAALLATTIVSFFSLNVLLWLMKI